MFVHSFESLDCKIRLERTLAVLSSSVKQNNLHIDGQIVCLLLVKSVMFGSFNLQSFDCFFDGTKIWAGAKQDNPFISSNQVSTGSNY